MLIDAVLGALNGTLLGRPLPGVPGRHRNTCGAEPLKQNARVARSGFTHFRKHCAQASHSRTDRDRCTTA